MARIETEFEIIASTVQNILVWCAGHKEHIFGEEGKREIGLRVRSAMTRAIGLAEQDGERIESALENVLASLFPNKASTIIFPERSADEASQPLREPASSPERSEVLTRGEAVSVDAQLRRALNALYLHVPASVGEDISEIVKKRIAELEDTIRVMKLDIPVTPPDFPVCGTWSLADVIAHFASIRVEDPDSRQPVIDGIGLDWIDAHFNQLIWLTVRGAAYGARMRRIAELERHITSLQATNTDEVERRRDAERKLALAVRYFDEMSKYVQWRAKGLAAVREKEEVPA